jgi:hypothetical protein
VERRWKHDSVARRCWPRFLLWITNGIRLFLVYVHSFDCFPLCLWSVNKLGCQPRSLTPTLVGIIADVSFLSIWITHGRLDLVEILGITVWMILIPICVKVLHPSGRIVLCWEALGVCVLPKSWTGYMRCFALWSSVMLYYIIHELSDTLVLASKTNAVWISRHALCVHRIDYNWCDKFVEMPTSTPT